MKDEIFKLLTKEVFSVLFAAAGWIARAGWKLAKDVRAAEARLEIEIHPCIRLCFGWLLLPLRVARIERKLGIGNGRYRWRLVRTRRVNKCFAEIRRKESCLTKSDSK